MNPQTKDPNRFSIIFEKLEEAKKAQDSSFQFELQAVSEIEETLSLFSEYEESINEPETGFVVIS